MANLLLYGLPLSANTHRVTLTLSLPPFEGCRFDLAKGEQYGVPVVALLVFTPICTSRLSSAAAQRR